MSHKEQRQFCKQVKKVLPNFFKRKTVIDVGSLDINGNNRYLFIKCNYIGVDIVKGKNVDLVGNAHEVLPNIEPKEVDAIISTECLEHDKHWMSTLTAMYNKLKVGGLLIITAAGDGRREHGTVNRSPQDSPGTNDYYKNISNAMFTAILPARHFSTFYMNQDKRQCDFQFYGIKN